MDPASSLPHTNGNRAESFRVLAYSHDSYGLGHLRRNITLVDTLLERAPQAQAICVTGASFPQIFALPDRCGLLKLPPITKNYRGRYLAKELPLSFGEITRLRSRLMLDAVKKFRPNLVLVDHTPTGPGGELVPVLQQLRRRHRETRCVLGLREILDSPARGRKELGDSGVTDILRSHYDEILVYGQADVFDYAKEYELPKDIAARLSYVGAVVPDRKAGTTAVAAQHDRSTPLRLLITTGGGEDGQTLMDGTISALCGPLADKPLQATFVTGPLMEDATWLRLQQRIAKDPRLSIRRQARNMNELLASTDLVVSMGGYNTVYGTRARGLPLLVLPREAPRQEQIERCRRLQAMGELTMMSPELVRDPIALAATIEASSLRPPKASGLAFDGASTTAEICLQSIRPSLHATLN